MSKSMMNSMVALSSGALLGAMPPMVWSMFATHWMSVSVQPEIAVFDFSFGLLRVCVEVFDIDSESDECHRYTSSDKPYYHGGRVTLAMLIVGVVACVCGQVPAFVYLASISRARMLIHLLLAAAVVATAAIAGAIGAFEHLVVRSHELAQLPSNDRPSPDYSFFLVIVSLVAAITAALCAIFASVKDPRRRFARIN